MNINPISWYEEEEEEEEEGNVEESEVLEKDEEEEERITRRYQLTFGVSGYVLFLDSVAIPTVSQCTHYVILYMYLICIRCAMHKLMS